MSNKTADVTIGELTIALKPLTIDQLEQYTTLADGSSGSVFRVVKFVLKECGGIENPGALVATQQEIGDALGVIMQLNSLGDKNPPAAVPQAAS